MLVINNFRRVEADHNTKIDMVLGRKEAVFHGWAVYIKESDLIVATSSEEDTVDDILEFMESNPGSILIQAPEFDPEGYDSFIWPRIADELEYKEQTGDITDDGDGNKLVCVYLGTIFNIYPSGKMYTPFANSNVERCPFCVDGHILNPFENELLRGYIQARRMELTKVASEQYGLYCDWSDHLKADAKTLDLAAEAAGKHFQCPYCLGMGSREAKEDELYRDYLERKADELGAFIDGSLGDGDSVFICKAVHDRT